MSRKLLRYLVIALSLGIINVYAQNESSASVNLPDFTSLVKTSSPAVVNISSQKKVNRQNYQIPDLDGLPPIFRDFFERGIPNIPPQDAQSLGSGFIISSDGYILTNNHVVADADEITVRMSDRTESKAKLIGTDPRSDVALLKIEGKNLPTVPLGKSENLQVGEWVLAIGSPFGFDHSVTAGIVSAKGRSLPNENYVPFIQTDVAINPGNSGGPLFNLQGEVVGINSQIFTRSGGFMGLSFAIPIDVAMNVANQLKTEGKVSRGYLGIIIQEVNRDLAESFGLEKPMGALITQIDENSAAAKGGLKVGDIVVSANKTPITISSDLPHLIGNLKAGDTVNLEIIRDGKRRNLNIKVGVLPNSETEIAKNGKAVDNNKLGVAVSDLTVEQKKSLSISGGVVISNIENGVGAMIGLRRGDVITHINNQAVTSANVFNKLVDSLPKNRSISLRVLSEGNARFITFKLED